MASEEDFLLIDDEQGSEVSYPFVKKSELILRMCHNYWITGLQEVNSEKEGPIYSENYLFTNCVN